MIAKAAHAILEVTPFAISERKEIVQKYLATNDLLFRKMLTSKDSGTILKAFVKDMLGKEFKTLTPRETYHIDSYKKTHDTMKIMRTEVDVLAVAEDGSQVTIEMQIQPHHFFQERALFYLAKAYVSPYGNEEAEAYIESNNFSGLCPTYGINIVDFHLFSPDEAALQSFSLRNDKSSDLFLGRNQQTILSLCFFSLKNKNIEPATPLAHWQHFFKTGEVDENAPQYIKEAKQKIDYYQLNEEEKTMIMRIDKAKAIKNAELAMAREEGIDIGKLEVAANLLRMGMALEQIAQGTGLSLEQIKELKEEQS